jgi:hypothetical protein
VIIAIDFDGTLARWADFPNIGEEVPYAIPIVQRLIASGHDVYIWTCRGGEYVTPVKHWLKEREVKYKGINQRHDTVSPSPKIIADLYIDDKALCCPLIPDSRTGRSYVDWLVVEYHLKNMGLYTIVLGE